MTRRIAVRGIIVHDGKLLCFKLKPYQDAIAGDYWCTPGGTLEPGESLVIGLEREMVEETGIKPTAGNLLYVQQFAHDGKEHLEFFFRITNTQDYLDFDPTNTTHGATEIADYAFIDPAEHTVLPKFLTTEPLNQLESQPAKVFDYL